MRRDILHVTAQALSILCVAATSLGTAIPAWGAPPERPTFNHTADPRPNILPNWIYTHHVPYRARYNRPTYHVGKSLYYVISPTSLEAMSWKENLDAGRYDGHHCPPMWKSYFYPKPWEVLNTGPRPNYTVVSTSPAPMTPAATAPQAVPLPPSSEVVTPAP